MEAIVSARTILAVFVGCDKSRALITFNAKQLINLIIGRWGLTPLSHEDNEQSTTALQYLVIPPAEIPYAAS